MSRGMTDPRVCTRSGTPSAHAVRAAKHTWADAPVTSRVAQMEWVCGSTNKMLCPSTPLFVSPVPMSHHTVHNRGEEKVGWGEREKGGEGGECVGLCEFAQLPNLP